MKTYWGVDVQLYTFLASALDGGEWSASLPSPLNPGGKALSAHRIGVWVGPRTSVDAVRKKNIPITATVGNLNSVVQPAAWSLY
jgi:hypothetical protein